MARIHMPIWGLVTLVASASGAQDLPKPQQVENLQWLVGSWEGKGKISFGGRETKVETRITFVMDGQFLKAIASDKSGGFTLTKTNMIGWSHSKKQYVSYTFTNMSPDARVAYGDVATGSLTLTSEPWEAEGMKLIARETYSKAGAGRIRVVMEAKLGDKWSKQMDLILTEAK